MELPRLLIDTSIIIEHLRKQNRRKSILYRIAGDYDLCTSTIDRRHSIDLRLAVDDFEHWTL